MSETAQIVICGAGITGAAAACFLSQKGVKDVLLIDERPPLSLTSDHSTECYRNWWPDPAMTALMNRSIELMERLAEKSGNAFHLNHRGYLYGTADESQVARLISRSQSISKHGGGELRIHYSIGSNDYFLPSSIDSDPAPGGADLLFGNELVHKYHPFLSKDAVAALHVRRAGWLSAQQLGMHLLESARLRGTQFLPERVASVEVQNGRVKAVQLDSGKTVYTPIFINAAGPFFKEVGKMLGLEIPVFTEYHMKAAIKDSLQVVPRNAPLLIWDDPQSLAWNEEERESLSEDPLTRWMTEILPAGVHTRPEGGADSQTILLLWEYRNRAMQPVWPPPRDDTFAEIALRGLAAMVPRFREYFTRIPQPQVDGGYYTRTRENRPLIGKTEVEGAYLIGAVSGFGIMSACAAGELLANCILGSSLPDYARSFSPLRYRDPEYLENWSELADDGQL
jgi:glycine/D-amino acid oxidase-like deaminating enzyme